MSAEEREERVKLVTFILLDMILADWTIFYPLFRTKSNNIGRPSSPFSVTKVTPHHNSQTVFFFFFGKTPAKILSAGVGV
jgi:hypothetical protein